MKEFTITGVCVPERNYMVDISAKMAHIASYIDKGRYFTINRARQYGKTTTFSQISRQLSNQYHIVFISFEGVDEAGFSDSEKFVKMFLSMVGDSLQFTDLAPELIAQWQSDSDESVLPFDRLSRKVTRLCRESDKKIVLLIDEVDKCAANQVFLNFLGMLRSKYLFRELGRDVTFHSVILAGVYDIKNLKLKLRGDEEQKYNSPWNIATDFLVDMSFSAEEIATMLLEYEADYQTGMDIGEISRELYFYTSGYPFLVSWLCKWIDEKGGRDWTAPNVRNAEKALLKTKNTLFDDLIKNVENNGELRDLVIRILYDGYAQAFNLADPVIELGAMFHIFTEREYQVAISNIIFETYLYDYVVSIKSREWKGNAIGVERSQFIEADGSLNMVHVLEKFQEVMRAEYRREDGGFLEQQGRLLFLCFLKPIINGTGFYYVEPETRNNTRMDIVVVYRGVEFIIELKIWHGEEYRRAGIRQLEGYMDSRKNETGYLISLSFNKEKEYRARWIGEEETEKKIFEVVV